MPAHDPAGRGESAGEDRRPEAPERAGGERTERWSGEVTEHSDALDLEPGVFTWSDPERIAASLKRSAEVSTRRRGTPFQSAMSMLTFYVNRAGAGLDPDQREVLERSKVELRRAFGRE